MLVDDTQNQASNQRLVPEKYRSPEAVGVEDQICEATPLVSDQTTSNKCQATYHEPSPMVTMVTHLPDDTIITSEMVNCERINDIPSSNCLVLDIAPPKYNSTSGNLIEK